MCYIHICMYANKYSPARRANIRNHTEKKIIISQTYDVPSSCILYRSTSRNRLRRAFKQIKSIGTFKKKLKIHFIIKND